MKKGNSYILGIIQLIVALGAIPTGLSMVFVSDGSQLGIPTHILSSQPFKDLFIPGIFLLNFNGLGNFIGSILSFRKNPYAGLLGIFLGIFLVVWICIQLFFTGFIHFLQPVFLIIGLLEIGFGYSLMRELKS